MNRYLAFILGAYLFLPVLCFAQTPHDAHMQHDMSGMQHEMQQAAPTMAVPDLLKEAMNRKALSLHDFEEMALHSNPTLKQANSLIQRAAGQAKQAGLYPNPSVGYQGEQIRGGAYRGGEQGAFVQQTIVLGGKLGLRRHVFEAQRSEEELGAVEQRDRVNSAVAQGFYQALAAQETVQIREKLMKLSLDAVETAHQLANVGQADAPDVLQAEVEAEQAKVDYTTAQRAFIQQFRSLAALAGNVSLPMTKLEGNLEEAPPIDPHHIIDVILRDSPAVKRAKQAVQVAEAQLKSARREPIPDLTLRAGLQQNYEPINGAGLPTGLQGFADASVTLPIFNRNQGNVQAARAELERAQSEVSRVELELRQTAEPLLQTYLADQEQAARYKNEMIPRAFHAYQLYLNKYRAMAAAYPEVIVSQRTFFQLEASYIQTLQNLWMNAVALQHFTLTGGLNAPASADNSATTINLPGSSR